MKALGVRLAGVGRPLTSSLPGHHLEHLLHCRVDVVRHHGETGQGWSAHCCSDGYFHNDEKSPASDQFVAETRGVTSSI